MLEIPWILASSKRLLILPHPNDTQMVMGTNRLDAKCRAAETSLHSVLENSSKLEGVFSKVNDLEHTMDECEKRLKLLAEKSVPTVSTKTYAAAVSGDEFETADEMFVPGKDSVDSSSETAGVAVSRSLPSKRVRNEISSLSQSSPSNRVQTVTQTPPTNTVYANGQSVAAGSGPSANVATEKWKKSVRTKMRAVKATSTSGLSKLDIESWLASSESGLSEYTYSVDLLSGSKSEQNFRIVCNKWPVDKKMEETGNWAQKGLTVRKWYKQIQDLGRVERIRRLVGGVDASSKTSSIDFLRSKLKELYSGRKVHFDVVEFSGFKSVSGKKFYVIEIGTTDRNENVDDLLTPYCLQCGVKSRPWRGGLPNKQRKVQFK